jgi:predicted translin family RNA/ssDNA-binding protein
MPKIEATEAKGIEMTAATVALEVAGEIGKLILTAIANNDVTTLKKVSDIFPRGHKLRSEITYALEMEKLRKKLANVGVGK